MRIDQAEALRRAQAFAETNGFHIHPEALIQRVAELIMQAVVETRREAATTAAIEYQKWRDIDRGIVDLQVQVAGMGAAATIAADVMVARAHGSRTVTSSELLSAVLAYRVREGQPHTYLSTMCVHDRHAECRANCKACHAKCICACHGE